MLLALALLAQRPKLDYRYVYIQTNLLVPDNVRQVKALFERAEKAGYNGVVITDSKFERLPDVPAGYVQNVREVAAKAAACHLKLIPVFANVGWADSLLSHNPNLVEGQTVRDANFVVHGNEAVLEPDPQAVFKNGSFEASRGDQALQMGFQDEPGVKTFIDRRVKHGGDASLRMTNPEGNCRIEQEIPVTPHRQYHFSVWAKSEAIDRTFEIKALDGNGQAMSEQSAGLQPTQDWRELHLTFNSGESKVARLYMGFWGGHRGSVWLDDAKLEEVGLLNVIRRSTCPVVVRGADGSVLAEGKDYTPISDPKMGNVPWPGAFEVFHPAPSIKVLPGSRIHEGDHVKVSFDHAVVLADGKVSICLSDPATDEVISKVASELEKLFHPAGFFLGHDEIRSGGSDDTCLASRKIYGELLGTNARRCVQTAQKAHRGAETYVWSDMFDPFHNAVPHYYLVRSSVERSWEGLPKDTIIMNWNSGRARESLEFFAKRGHRQMLAGFYDADVSQIKTWLAQAQGLQGVCGVMYTTWRGDYSKLEEFARAAWGG